MLNAGNLGMKSHSRSISWLRNQELGSLPTKGEEFMKHCNPISLFVQNTTNVSSNPAFRYVFHEWAKLSYHSLIPTEIWTDWKYRGRLVPLTSHYRTLVTWGDRRYVVRRHHTWL